MRSFGGGSGGKMGGGSGGMIRNVQRVIRAGVGGAPTETFSASANATTTVPNPNTSNAKHFNAKRPVSSNTALTLSSGSNTNGTQPFPSVINFPAPGAYVPAWGHGSLSTCSNESESECIDGIEDGRELVFYEDYVFGTVPSKVEVEHTVSALKQELGPPGPIKRNIAEDPEMDWVEPTLHFSGSRKLHPHGSDRVYDAIHMLQKEPSVQEMVISLSSDKALWEAVLNNDVVKEVRGRFTRAHKLQDQDNDESSGKGGPDASNSLKDILRLIASSARVKIMQLIDKISKVLSEAFQLPNDGNKRDGEKAFEDNLRASVLISVMVLLIVVVTRVRSG